MFGLPPVLSLSRGDFDGNSEFFISIVNCVFPFFFSDPPGVFIGRVDELYTWFQGYRAA